MLHEKTKNEVRRQIQENKNNVISFHETIEKVKSDTAAQKRIEDARKKGFITDDVNDEDYPDRPNVLVTAVYGAIAMIIIAASIILLVT